MSRIEHPVSAEELMAYADGELHGVPVSELEKHLQQCPDCTAALADLRSLSQQMASWQIEEPSANVTERVFAELNQAPAVPELPGRKKPRWTFGRVAAFGFAGVSLALLMVSLFIPSLLRSRQAAATVSDEAVAPEGFVSELSRQGQQGRQGRQVPPAQAPNGPMVIRSIKLTLVTKEFDPARSKIDTIMRQSQGYVDRLMVRANPGSVRSLSATLRLPASQADSGLTELKKLGRLVEESQSSSEITGQYVDLTARLSNARNSEQRLLGLLRDRTGNLKDVVDVERELSSVRESIERMEAQRKDLDNKVQFVTVDLELTEEYRAQLEPPAPSRDTQLRNAAVDGIRSAAESIMDTVLFALEYGPMLVIWLIVIGSLLALILKLRGKWSMVIR